MIRELFNIDVVKLCSVLHKSQVIRSAASSVLPLMQCCLNPNELQLSQYERGISAS